RRVLFGALAFFASWLATSTALAQRLEDTSDMHAVARVIASGGVHGHLLDPICDRDRTLVPADEGLFTYGVVRAAHEHDHPLVVDAGGLLAPNGVMRFTAEHDADALAAMVQALGYRALAFGETDLGAPRPDMLAI